MGNIPIFHIPVLLTLAKPEICELGIRQAKTCLMKLKIGMERAENPRSGYR